MYFDLNKLHSYSKTLIFIFCNLSLLALSLNIDIATKFLHISGTLAFFYFCLSSRKGLVSNPAFYIFCALCIFGILNLTWYSLFKQDGTIYANAYRGPMETGKILLFSAFILIALVSNDGNSILCNVKKVVFYSALLTIALFFVYSMWQHFYLHISRSYLSTSHATTAAYVILFPSVLLSIIVLTSNIKFKSVIFGFFFLLSLLTIISTETRAAILVFITISIVILLLDAFIKRKVDYKLCLFFILTVIISLFIFKDALENRINSFNSDIARYSNDNSRSSVGARLAMYEVGLKTYSIFGQSIEERANKIRKLEKKEPRLGGALPYVKSHLHNDIIETLSTRGILGVCLIILMYLSIAIYSFKNAKQPYILILLICLILLGLSDVVLFSKSVPTAFFISLILMCVFFKFNKRVMNHSGS